MNMTDLRTRMENTLDALKREFSGLRTGRANADLLSGVQVEAYGAMTPLNQVANVSVPDARMLAVNVWDKTMVAAVDKAIREANLGLNPIVDGQNLRLPMPDLTEERRKDLAKLAKQYAEESRVALRNIRRDGMDAVKKLKDDGIGEDEQRAHENDVQKLTDDMVKRVDDMLAEKEVDIMKV